VRTLSLRGVVAWLACLASTAALATTVSKPEVTFEIPDGWVEVPAQVLQQFHEEMKRQAPLAQVPKYDYAFQSAAGPPWLAYPYLLVKVTPTGRPTEHDLETLPTINLDDEVRAQQDAWSKIMKQTSLGKMRYDKATNIVWIPSQSQVVGIGAVTGLSGVIPTEQGFVELHAYALASDFPARAATFEKLITGAKIAPDLLYKPRWSDKLGPAAGLFDSKSLLSRLAILIVIGILVAVFVGRRRKQN
jgi:hypothetical protein